MQYRVLGCSCCRYRDRFRERQVHSGDRSWVSPGGSRQRKDQPRRSIYAYAKPSLRHDACVVAGIAKIAAGGAGVTRLGRVGTQWPAARHGCGGEIGTAGDDLFGCRAMLDLVHERREQVELVCRRAATAMAHVGDEVKAGKFLCFVVASTKP